MMDCDWCGKDSCALYSIGKITLCDTCYEKATYCMVCGNWLPVDAITRYDDVNGSICTKCIVELIDTYTPQLPEMKTFLAQDELNEK